MIVSYDEAAAFVGDPTLAGVAAFTETVDFADSFVKSYCRRQFERGRYTVRLAGTNESTLILPEVVDVLIEVRVDIYGQFDVDTLQDLTRFVIGGAAEDSRGLTSLDMPFYVSRMSPNVDTTVVIFDGGYWPATDADPLHVPKMPADLRRAVKLIVAAEQRLGAGESFQGERLGDYSYQRKLRSSGAGGDHFPYDDRVREILDAYANWA